MVEVGDTAPEFTAPMATPENAEKGSEYTAEHVAEFTLSDALVDGPVVLAFFPGVYSRTCTQELCEVRDWRAAVGDLDARVYGVSADTPWAQLAFVAEYDLTYPLLSGFNNSVVADYGMAVETGVLAGISGRAVFVVDEDGTVTYRWDGDGLRELPDLDAVAEALDAAA